MRRHTMRHVAGIFLIAWTLILLWLTVLGRSYIEQSFYYIPFQTTVSMIRENPWYEITYLIIGNIAWFIPIGLLLPFSLRIPLWQAILCGAGLSIAIEVSQYLFSVGCTDIDDLIYNTLGTAIGALIYYLLRKKLPHLF